MPQRLQRNFVSLNQTILIMKPSSLSYLIFHLFFNFFFDSFTKQMLKKTKFPNKNKPHQTQYQQYWEKQTEQFFFKKKLLCYLFFLFFFCCWHLPWKNDFVFGFFVCFYIIRSKLTLPEIKSISCNLMLCLKNFLP